jgi:hypothetical protein
MPAGPAKLQPIGVTRGIYLKTSTCWTSCRTTLPER